MTRGHQLIRGSLIRTFQTILVIAITFVMTPVILHSLEDIYPDKDAYYGLWRLVGTFMGYYGMLDLGISSAIGRFLSRAVGQERPQDEKEIVDTSLVIYFFISLLVMLVTGAVMWMAPLIVQGADLIHIFRILVFLGGLNIAITLPFRVFSGILTARLRFDLISISSMMVLVSRYVGIYIFLKMGYGLIAMGLINLIASITEALAFFLLSTPYKIFRIQSIQFHRHRMKELFSYSSITFFATIADMLRSQTDNLVITIFRGTAMVTPYSFPFQLVQYAHQILRSVMGTIGPIFSQDEGRNDFESIREKFLFTSKICSVLAILIYSGLAIYGSAFITRWIGIEYENIQAVLLWLTIALFMDAIQLPSVHLLYAISKHKYYLLVNSADGVLNLILSLILVRKFGIVGVAMGTAIPSILLRAYLQPRLTCSAISLPLRSYTNTMLKAVVPLIAFNTFYFLATRRFVAPSYNAIFILATIQSLLYLPLAWWIIFTRSERINIYDHLSRRKRGLLR